MRQRKAPFRASSEITQQYNDGVVSIYGLTDISKPGYQPKPQYTLKWNLRFERRALGIQRIYLSRQAQAEIKHVIRVPKVPISPQDVAVIRGEDTPYKISTVQQAMDVYTPSIDLSLTDITQDMEVNMDAENMA